MANPNIKWAARLAHVREVTLTGTADLAYWTNRLKPQDLQPRPRDGKAQIMILAADSKYMGLAFREMSISIAVLAIDNSASNDAACLLAAWNARRFFAFCERTFFATPYRHGDVQVRAIPAALRLLVDGAEAFQAEMKSDRAQSHNTDDAWDGPIFFPSKKLGPGHGKVFFAKLTGQAHIYPFLPESDSLRINPAHKDDTLAALLESHFAPEQWSIRPDAAHAKSKTYRRSDFSPPTP
jgi:hypothetical protein